MASHKYDLAWLEPGGYRFAKYREEGGLIRLRKIALNSAAVCFVGLAVLELLRTDRKMGWPAAMGIAAAAWGFFLLISTITLFLPANVFIHQTGISRTYWQGNLLIPQFCAWEKIEVCHLGRKKIRDRDYPALWLIAPDRTVSMLIGINPKTSEESIRSALARYPVAIQGSLAPQNS